MKQMNFDFESRRSMVVAQRGMVSASNPMAAQAGLRILQQGGNAADAAIATAAMMNVFEPSATGIGGDCFALYYDAKSGKVSAMNGSGRSPKDLSIEHVRQEGVEGDSIPGLNVHAITVPGAARGWEDLVKKFGTMPLTEVLKDAIFYAENGFAVAPAYGAFWGSDYARKFLSDRPNAQDYIPNGKTPSAGDVIRLPGLARTFRTVAEEGADAYYKGQIAKNMVETIQARGSLMTLEDLASHETSWDDPITTDYRGYTVAEHPPNGQGLAALIALNIAEGWELGEMSWNDPAKLHLMIEAMRLAFADVKHYVADPQISPAPLNFLLSKEYASERRAMVSQNSAMTPPSFGAPVNTSDTIYLCVVDGQGNACSFINSLYQGGTFGSGVAVKDYGFFLQNRGSNFVLTEGHPNALEGGKRPYHTIIPGMLLKDDELIGPFGVMGGFMQPQGHFQVVNAMIDDDLNPQDALNRPRWQVNSGDADGEILIEEGYSVQVMAELARLGHQIRPISGRARGNFGRGHIILRDNETGVLFGGAEPRSDGQVAGY
ncbi:MAG: gamma-glutamyltransferase family protein [Phototrophicaceae bacterium]